MDPKLLYCRKHIPLPAKKVKNLLNKIDGKKIINYFFFCTPIRILVKEGTRLNCQIAVIPQRVPKFSLQGVQIYLLWYLLARRNQRLINQFSQRIYFILLMNIDEGKGKKILEDPQSPLLDKSSLLGISQSPFLFSSHNKPPKSTLPALGHCFFFPLSVKTQDLYQCIPPPFRVMESGKQTLLFLTIAIEGLKGKDGNQKFFSLKDCQELSLSISVLAPVSLYATSRLEPEGWLICFREKAFIQAFSKRSHSHRNSFRKGRASESYTHQESMIQKKGLSSQIYFQKGGDFTIRIRYPMKNETLISGATGSPSQFSRVELKVQALRGLNQKDPFPNILSSNRRTYFLEEYSADIHVLQEKLSYALNRVYLCENTSIGLMTWLNQVLPFPVHSNSSRSWMVPRIASQNQAFLLPILDFHYRPQSAFAGSLISFGRESNRLSSQSYGDCSPLEDDP